MRDEYLEVEWPPKHETVQEAEGRRTRRVWYFGLFLAFLLGTQWMTNRHSIELARVRCEAPR